MVADGEIKSLERMHALNLLTVLCASQAALPHLLKSPAARIVNIGAMGALQAGAGMGPYAASKAGVTAYEALAAEHRGKITVNAVLPSTISNTAANREEHAEVRLLEVGEAAGARRGDPVSGQRRRRAPSPAR